MTQPDHGIDPTPPILYWSRSLAVHQITVDGPMASLPGIVDMTAPTIPMAMDEGGSWQSLRDLPADAVWLAGGETSTEWAAIWPPREVGLDSQVEEHDEVESRRVASMFRSNGVRAAKRTVTRGPWQVVPNGEPS